MLRNRSKWVVVTSIIAVSLALSGVAIATGSTGSVVSVVLGAGSTDEKFELQRQTRHQHRRGELHVRTELVDRLAHASGPDARYREVGHLHRVPRGGLRPAGLRTRGRVRGAPDRPFTSGGTRPRKPSNSEWCSSRYRSAVALGSTSRSRRPATSRRPPTLQADRTTARAGVRGRPGPLPVCPSWTAGRGLASVTCAPKATRRTAASRSAARCPTGCGSSDRRPTSDRGGGSRSTRRPTRTWQPAWRAGCACRTAPPTA